MSSDLLSKGLDSDIGVVHERFVAAMASRLPNLSVETKERYFAVVSALVSKLEMPEKNLREILQEMMAEAAAIVLQEMSAAS
jgi:RNA processing factor Prp31